MHWLLVCSFIFCIIYIFMVFGVFYVFVGGRCFFCSFLGFYVCVVSVIVCKRFCMILLGVIYV